ncbi:MAG: hypothetical protein GTN36_05485 [Candidatus Aenigmarchaeota archaeon]|nr:hypothetical protein [Candidatus Aenigmarchaeota archaeon]
MSNVLKPLSNTATVTSAGTAVPFSSTSKVVRSINIQADVNNVGNVFIGSSDVDSTNGIELAPGNTMSIEAPMMGMSGADDLDLNNWYVDAANSNDSIRIVSMIRP